MIKLLAKLKYRFDVAQSCLSFFSYIFILIAASDKISTLVHIPAKILLVILVPLTLSIVLYTGHILLRLRFMESYTEEVNKQNKMLKDILDK